jgi:hypothetical protein
MVCVRSTGSGIDHHRDTEVATQVVDGDDNCGTESSVVISSVGIGVDDEHVEIWNLGLDGRESDLSPADLKCLSECLHTPSMPQAAAGAFVVEQAYGHGEPCAFWMQ